MKRYKQFEKLVVEDFEIDLWDHPLHNHNYFEIIYIVHGAGVHHLNNARNDYHAGDIFLLGPDDTHEFVIEKKSRFIYVKFTKLYLSEPQDRVEHYDWREELEQLFLNTYRQEGRLQICEDDLAHVRTVMEMISREYRLQKSYKPMVLYQLFSILMTLIKRNNSFLPTEYLPADKASMEEVIDYIEKHIYEPQKLTLRNLAKRFNYSAHYFGNLFKLKMNTTLSEYTRDYRLKLIENRLRNGKEGMKKLSAEFGFVDESHFNKFFKKHMGKAPSKYRKEYNS